MVNDGFPESRGYGFEMVDGRLTRRHGVSIKNLRRIKPIEFFASSSRFNFNASTCDLSTTASVVQQVRHPDF
jgi:hypothetical protein